MLNRFTGGCGSYRDVSRECSESDAVGQRHSAGSGGSLHQNKSSIRLLNKVGAQETLVYISCMTVFELFFLVAFYKVSDIY